MACVVRVGTCTSTELQRGVCSAGAARAARALARRGRRCATALLHGPALVHCGTGALELEGALCAAHCVTLCLCLCCKASSVACNAPCTQRHPNPNPNPSCFVAPLRLRPSPSSAPCLAGAQGLRGPWGCVPCGGPRVRSHAVPAHPQTIKKKDAALSFVCYPLHCRGAGRPATRVYVRYVRFALCGWRGTRGCQLHAGPLGLLKCPFSCPCI